MATQFLCLIHYHSCRLGQKFIGTASEEKITGHRLWEFSCFISNTEEMQVTTREDIKLWSNPVRFLHATLDFPVVETLKEFVRTYSLGRLFELLLTGCTCRSFTETTSLPRNNSKVHLASFWVFCWCHLRFACSVCFPSVKSGMYCESSRFKGIRSELLLIRILRSHCYFVPWAIKYVKSLDIEEYIC